MMSIANRAIVRALSFGSMCALDGLDVLPVKAFSTTQKIKSIMRPQIAILDEALGPTLERFRNLLPAHWHHWIVTTSINGPRSCFIRTPRTKSQSCICNGPGCIRDVVLAELPDRAIVAVVIVQAEILCLSLCADAVFVPNSLVGWCRAHGIPSTHARSISELALLWERFVRTSPLRTRYQAHRYRHHCMEIE